MSNIDRTTNWEAYENGESDAKNILYRSGDVLTRIGQAIDEFSNDETLSKPGQLSYKFGYLDAITRALKDESERVKNDIMTFYVEGETEDNGRESDESGRDQSGSGALEGDQRDCSEND